MADLLLVFLDDLPSSYHQKAQFLAAYSVYCREMRRYLIRRRTGKKRLQPVVHIPDRLIQLWQEVEKYRPDWRTDALPISEVSRRYGLAPASLRRWAAIGEVRAEKRGRLGWWLCEQDVLAKLKN